MNIPFVMVDKELKIEQDEIIKGTFSARTVGGRYVKQSEIRKDAYQMFSSGDVEQLDIGGNATQIEIHGDSKQMYVKGLSKQYNIGGNATQHFVGEAYMNHVVGNGTQSDVSGDSFMHNIEGDGGIWHIKGTAYAGKIGGNLIIGDIKTFKTDNHSQCSKLIIDGNIEYFDGERFVCPEYELIQNFGKYPSIPKSLEDILEKNSSS